MSRRKNYTNHRRQGMSFRVEDRAYLQATPLKGNYGLMKKTMLLMTLS